MGARAERAHRAVRELADPVRGAHQQPPDRNVRTQTTVRASAPVPALVRRHDRFPHRLVEAKALRDPRARDQVATVVTNRDACVVQQPGGQHLAPLLRTESEAASHLVRQVRDTRGVPPRLLLSDVEGAAEVREYLNPPHRTKQPGPREREVGIGDRSRAGSLLHHPAPLPCPREAHLGSEVSPAHDGLPLSSAAAARLFRRAAPQLAQL